MWKEITKVYGLKLYSHNRINAGGCKLFSAYETVPLPEGLRLENVLNLFKAASYPEWGEIYKNELLYLITQIEMIENFTNISTTNINGAANSQILARLIAFKPENNH